MDAAEGIPVFQVCQDLTTCGTRVAEKARRTVERILDGIISVKVRNTIGIASKIT